MNVDIHSGGARAAMPCRSSVVIPVAGPVNPGSPRVSIEDRRTDRDAARTVPMIHEEDP